MNRLNMHANTGWSFPPEITNEGSQISTITFEQDIKESLKILFTTLPGQRIAHPLYGCDLHQFMFRPINSSLISDMEKTIRDAITLFEPRIALAVLQITPNMSVLHQLDIYLEYELRQVSTRNNITIPFYTMEETL